MESNPGSDEVGQEGLRASGADNRLHPTDGHEVPDGGDGPDQHSGGPEPTAGAGSGSGSGSGSGEVMDDMGEDDTADDHTTDDDTDEPGEGRDPLRFSNWMKRSATGAVMTGIAVGLKEALQPQKKEVPFVIESRGDPDDPDKPIDLHFDPDSPQATVAIIRRPAGAAPAPSPSPPAEPTNDGR